MITLSKEQTFKLANAMLLKQWPDVFSLQNQPEYIQAIWISEARHAVDGYNMVTEFLKSENNKKWWEFWK